MNITPRIYVACLASYNAGTRHGAWIDLDPDPDNLWHAIRDMLAESPEEGAEEWAIHDYEMPKGIRITEYESMEELAEMAQAFEEVGEDDVDLFCLWYDYDGPGGLPDIDDALRYLDAYLGKFSSLEEYAEQYVDDCCDLPEFAARYFDYAAFARDLEMGGDVYAIRTGYGEVHVFDAHA